MDYSTASLVDTADAIAAGRAGVQDVVEACLDRYRRIGRELACFVDLDEAGAIDAAKRADRTLRDGGSVGPLFGVPLAHKDLYYRAGRVSACGSRLRDDFRPANTATVLERLDAAGGIEIGRLAMVEFAMGPHGFNANYDHCRNPWNTDYIPCGSSSGSGVAVGARLVHGSLGSDTGGSIRCPAAVSGVVGLVPTHGRVSRFGVMPMSPSMDIVGPLARTARDCARVFDIIAGHDPKDGSTFTRSDDGAEVYIEQADRLPRIGVARGYFDADLHPEVPAAHDAALAAVGDAGFEVSDVTLPADLLQEVADLHPLLMKVEAAANHMPDMRSAPDRYTTEVGLRIQAGFFPPGTEYLQSLKLRGAYLRAIAAIAFADVDLLFTPVLSIPVPTIEETSNKRGTDYLDMVVALTRNTKVVNYLGLPAISVPCGFTDNGLPTSFQLIGRPFAEPQLLLAADRFQQETDWHRHEPALIH
jgi:aspartyl-tRNA(Asn)/glutamyl-tRNA(Gln) amidotransferase subunit A